MTPGAILLALALGGSPPGTATPPPQATPTPFARAEDRAVGYEGPGREEEPPEGLTEIRIGWFAPGELGHPEGGAFWRGATLARDEANAEGGLRGVPFRLVVGWSDSPWAGGGAQVARLVFRERVWAIVGSIDGAATHVAEQVAVKAGILVLGPGGTDESVNLANVPWMLSLLPSDGAQAPPLVEALAGTVIGRPFAVLSGTDHDSRAAWDALRAELARRGMSPSQHFELPPDEKRLEMPVTAIVARRPRAVVVLAGARAAGRLARALRAAGHAGPILGGATLGRDGFREEAREAAEGVVFPLLVEPSPAWASFVTRFRSRFGSEPDYAAGSAYDAIRLLVAGIRTAGANRPRILDAVRALSPFAGVTGTVAFDRLGRNARPVGLGTIRDGRVVPLQVKGAPGRSM